MFLDGTSGVPATSYKAGTKVLPEEMCFTANLFFFFWGVGFSKHLELPRSTSH